MTTWQSKEFKTLQKEWYEKLSQEGFVDIETTIGLEQELIQSATYPYRHDKNVNVRDNKQTYFELLCQWVSDEEFVSKIDELILTHRSEGLKITEIVAALKEQKLSRDRETIRFTIRKYEHKWGIRFWKAEQLTKTRKKHV